MVAQTARVVDDWKVKKPLEVMMSISKHLHAVPTWIRIPPGRAGPTCPASDLHDAAETFDERHGK